jgi:hypothetical protein
MQTHPFTMMSFSIMIPFLVGLISKGLTLGERQAISLPPFRPELLDVDLAVHEGSPCAGLFFDLGSGLDFGLGLVLGLLPLELGAIALDKGQDLGAADSQNLDPLRSVQRDREPAHSVQTDCPLLGDLQAMALIGVSLEGFVLLAEPGNLLLRGFDLLSLRILVKIFHGFSLSFPAFGY